MILTPMRHKDIIKGLPNTSLSPMKTENQNFEVEISFMVHVIILEFTEYYNLRLSLK